VKEVRIKPIILLDEGDDPNIEKIDISKNSDAGKGKKPNPTPDDKGKDPNRDPEDLGDDEGAAKKDVKPNKDNAAFAAMRVENTKLSKQVEHLTGQLNNVIGALQTIGGVPGAKSGELPIEERLVKDPIGTIKEIAVTAQREVSTQERFQRVLNDSRKVVVDKYPALRDSNSYEFQVYDEICRENPEYFNSPKGPIQAMRDMEERLIAEGKLDPNSLFSKNDSKAADSRRVINSPTGAGVGMRGGDMIGGKKAANNELDAAQLAYCKANGIDPKVYQQIIAKSSAGGYTV
jgi:hypothetical protein